MQEILAQVSVYLWGVWRHRWLGIIVAWAVAIGGWLLVWQMPDAYVASARVYVDTNSVLRPLLKGLAIQPNIEDRIAMMSRTLLSRPNREKLMRMTDMDLRATTDIEKEEILTDLTESISLSGDRDNASLYSISVTNKDRDVAINAAQSLITIFIESSLSQKREDSSGAQNFLDDQIIDYEKRLIAAETRLALFKQQNIDVLPGSGGDYYSRLQATSQEYELARLTLKEMSNRRRELQRQLDGEEPVFLSSSTNGTGAMSPLDTRIQSLRVSMDSLLTKYTDKHPEVRQIRGLIEELEAQKLVEYGEAIGAASGGGLSSLSNSPVYQGMRSMLAEAEAKEAELEVRSAEYANRVEQLNKKVNNIPEIEAGLKQLDRDYEVISGQHQELLERRESARLSQDVEQNASDVTFRVIDPPFAPLEPNEPNKPLLNSIAFAMGIFAGVGAGLVASLIYPIISDPRTLINISGLPLLGTVTASLRPGERRKEILGLVSFASCFFVLVVVFAGLSLGPILLSS
ncbi:MAG: polysaccharide chain length determinant protein (PEP-CTERM system associated) [Halioglobus sp.]|jgi:polysaccharide chain length determinant protein (PEP-CTERM system associated)